MNQEIMHIFMFQSS